MRGYNIVDVEGVRILVSHMYGLGIVLSSMFFLSLEILEFGERFFSWDLDISSFVFLSESFLYYRVRCGGGG